MGCFGDLETTGKKSTNSVQTTSPPWWAEEAGHDNYNRALALLNRGWQPYTGERVAGLSDFERLAGGKIKSLAGGNPWSKESAGMIRDFSSADPYKFDFSKVIDENGPLGSISSYMNPHTEAVLDPALREIARAGSQQRMGINRGATMSGAFGDARHGVVERGQREDEMQNVSDTTGRAYQQAFENAMGLRSSDLSRMFQTDQAQAGENNSALMRKLTGARELTDLDKYNTSRTLGVSQAMGGYGALQRGIRQQELDSGYEDYMKRQGFEPAMLQFLTSILNGTPMSKTMSGSSETTEQKPNNSGWSALGTGLSALLSFI